MNSSGHRVFGTDYGGSCLVCRLKVEERLEERNYPWPPCPGREWLCPANDGGTGGHLLVENAVEDVFCFYCDKPVEDLRAPRRSR